MRLARVRGDSTLLMVVGFFVVFRSTRVCACFVDAPYASPPIHPSIHLFVCLFFFQRTAPVEPIHQSTQCKLQVITQFFFLPPLLLCTLGKSSSSSAEPPAPPRSLDSHPLSIALRLFETPISSLFSRSRSLDSARACVQVPD